MKEYATTEQAIQLMLSAHHGQTDKVGRPYYMHPLRVMMRLGPHVSEHEKQIALLHDVVEDTPYSLEDLMEEPFHPFVVRGVEILTRKEDQIYKDYVNDILASNVTEYIRVKLADVTDNLCFIRTMELIRKDGKDNGKDRYLSTKIKLLGHLYQMTENSTLLPVDLPLTL